VDRRLEDSLRRSLRDAEWVHASGSRKQIDAVLRTRGEGHILLLRGASRGR
jgi:hypothetical protein